MEKTETTEISELKEKIRRLEKINKVLIDRVEKTISHYGSSFSLFQKNSILQDEISRKTQQLDQSILEIQRQRRAINEGLIFAETDEFGKILTVNEKFCEVSGYTKQELFGQSFNIVKSDIHPPEFWNHFWNSLKTNGAFRGEICNRRKNGELYWVESIIYPLFQSTGKISGYTSVQIDTTEKKSQQIKANHNEKLASIGELAAGIGHEVNNPLTIASCNVLLLKKNFLQQPVPPSADLMKKMELIETAHYRIKKIVDGLRVYSRIDHETVGDVSMLSSVSTTVDLVKGVYKTLGITVTQELPENQDFIVSANHGKLQQVLMNLITNARDATETCPERIIQVKLTKNSNNEVAMSVKDNGVGIPTHLRQKILEPFFTTKPVNQGTGIGLGIVNEFVKQFGGRLEIESELNHGSLFTVYLPIKSEITPLPKVG